MSPTGRGDRVTIALLFPDLLGTYGDSGNAVVLAQRLRWRGIEADILTIRSGDPVPRHCEVYVVGGGEDLPQAQAARQLGATAGGPLAAAVDRGAAVLAVCAGMQIVGTRFVGPDGVAEDGVGLLDCETVRGTGLRSVGEIVVDSDPALGVGRLSGYENHAGVTRVGPAATPLGPVRVGVGNGDGAGGDGAWAGRVVGTYLHGPVLARNPALADRLLGWAVGDLAPLDDTEVDALRAERLAAAGPEAGVSLRRATGLAALGQRAGRVVGDRRVAAIGRAVGSGSGAAAAVSVTALLTDRYELTMLDAARQAGMADRAATFEVFCRSLPDRRDYGVLAGTGRLLDALEDFTFDGPELDWLARARVVSPPTIDWLAAYRFSGDIIGYPEGEIYGPGSPVLTVEAPFGVAVLLETLALSILNHDSAVAGAASLITRAAAGRPVIEMGSRRTDPHAAVAAARAAYIGGFASTSNLEAGRRYGVPTAGTAAHAFMLAFPGRGEAEGEADAFRAQVAALGPETTLLVDTFDTEAGIRRAVEVAGSDLAAVRIDSGDLVEWAGRARALLDSLGAPTTKVVLTGDLDETSVRALAASPADAYGVGTSVVTGLGHPTAGFIYKLVAVDGWPVAKRSPGKATVGGRKWAWRTTDPTADVVARSAAAAPSGARALQRELVRRGVRQDHSTVEDARARHARAVAGLGPAGLTVRMLDEDS